MIIENHLGIDIMAKPTFLLGSERRKGDLGEIRYSPMDVPSNPKRNMD